MLLHFFHHLRNTVTKARIMFTVWTAFTWLPVRCFLTKWRGRMTIKTLFSRAFLSPGTKEVTERTVRRFILCIYLLCHLSVPLLSIFCTAHPILFQPLCSNTKQIHIPEILLSQQRSILFLSSFFSLHFS